VSAGSEGPPGDPGLPDQLTEIELLPALLYSSVTVVDGTHTVQF
jgi:hypothetical protein